MKEDLFVKIANTCILMINSSSLSIKFTLFEAKGSLLLILKDWVEMTDRQITAKVREYLNNWSPDIRRRANHPTQCRNKILLEISS